MAVEALRGHRCEDLGLERRIRLQRQRPLLRQAQRVLDVTRFVGALPGRHDPDQEQPAAGAVQPEQPDDQGNAAGTG